MNKKIVITGASSDIGISICEKVISPGDSVILQCFRNPEKPGFLKERFGENCEIISVDFNNPVALEEFCKKINDTDILINAAAYIKTDLLVNLSQENIEKMINVNIMALIKICNTALKDMIVRHKGCIINISSSAAERGNRGQNVYAGTKGFVESFTRALASEYGSRGIRINCVAPGPIGSGSLKELLNYAGDEVKQSVSLNRIGKPEDVAALVSFLCSEEASFIQGKIIGVDGGFNRGV